MESTRRRHPHFTSRRLGNLVLIILTAICFVLTGCSDGEYKYPRDPEILRRIPQQTLDRMSSMPDDYKVALAMRFDGVICSELQKDLSEAERGSGACTSNYDQVLGRSHLLISMGYQLREGPIPRKFTSYQEIEGMYFPIDFLSCKELTTRWRVCAGN